MRNLGCNSDNIVNDLHLITLRNIEQAIAFINSVISLILDLEFGWQKVQLSSNLKDTSQMIAIT